MSFSDSLIQWFLCDREAVQIVVTHGMHLQTKEVGFIFEVGTYFVNEKPRSTDFK